MATRRAHRLLLAIVGTVILGAASGGTALAEPALTATPTLDVSPTAGAPGDTFTATAAGVLRYCSMVGFSWAFGEIEATVDRGSGVAAATFEVPQDAAPQTYDVTAICGSFVMPSRTFTVIAPPVDLTLGLEPTQGRPGDAVTAVVNGAESCSDEPIEFLWDGATLDVADDGTFTVPVDAEPGPVAVTATACGSTSHAETFTVEPEPAEPPVLTLDRTSGPPGTELTASVTGFRCAAEDIEMVWGATPVGEPGPFPRRITVPAGAITGDNRVSATCVNDPDSTDDTTFVVTETVITSTTSEVVTTGTTDQATTASPTTEITVDPAVLQTRRAFPFWVIPLLVAAAVLAALGYRQSRKYFRHPEISAELRHGYPRTAVRETHKPGERTFAITLQTRADTGLHRITEVHDDRSS